MITKEKMKTRLKLITCLIMTVVLVVCCFPEIGFQYGEIYGYTEKTGTVNVETTLNVRDGAGTSGTTIIGSLSAGESVRIVGEQNSSDGTLWYKINYGQGTGYVSSNYITNVKDVIEYTEDADFEAYLNAQGFPESYKDSLRTLHAQYPKWVFVAEHLNYDWNTALTNQSVVGRSLITKSAISSWKSLDSKSYNWDKGTWYTFDGGAWCAASPELVAYYMDPRNFLNEDYIWMFESLSYESNYQTADKLEYILDGTFMEAGKNLVVNDETGAKVNYADILMIAAAKSKVSPFALASSILVEMGNNGASNSISGTVSGYTGIYNYYNWGAYASGGNTPIINGLIYSAKTDASTLRPWNTRYKSIVGGAIKFGASYINIGQDTLYYKKFDYIGTPYEHQYMTHIKAHATEAKKTASAYSSDLKNNSAIIFKIPVFKNMPDSACVLPTGDGSPNNCLSSLTVGGQNLTPTFSKFTTSYSLIVNNSVSSVNVSATPIVNTAKVTGTGNYTLKEGSNTITVKVTSESGAIRTYTIDVVRQTASSGGTTTTPGGTGNNTGQFSMSTTLIKNDTSLTVNGVSVGSTVADIKGKFTVTGGTVEVTNSAGTVKADGKVGTGDKVVVKNSSGAQVYSYTVVVYGDVNGDGAANIKDLLLMQKHILGIGQLQGVYLTASDTNRDSKDLSVKDLLILQKQILGTATIKQN